MARRDLGQANLRQLARCKKETKKEEKNMVNRDPKTGRFMKARRTQKKACACAKAKTAKAAVKKTAKKVAKKPAKKAKKA